MQERYCKAHWESKKQIERNGVFIRAFVQQFGEGYREIAKQGIERAIMNVCWKWAGETTGISEYDDENVIAFPWYERHIATEHPSVKRAAARRAAKS